MAQVLIHRDDQTWDKHKYVARVPIKSSGGGKQSYRYFYSQNEYQAYLKSGGKDAELNPELAKTQTMTINSGKAATSTTTVSKPSEVGKQATESRSFKSFISSSISGLGNFLSEKKESIDKALDKLGVTVATEAPKFANKAVDKTKEVINKLYDDKSNVFDINRYNYNDKIKQVAETDEWKAIVARQDPEYVRKNSDGTTSYLIDDYVAKKKMPVIDVLDDIISERPITVNKIEKDAIVAGIKAKFFGTLSIGMIGVGVVTKALLAKSKFQQGSYDDEIKRTVDNVSAGKEYVERSFSIANGTKVTDEDIKNVVGLVQKSADSMSKAKNANSNINEGKVIEAAQILLNSSAIPDSVKSNEAYTKAESVLSGLSEEEMAMLNLLITSAMKG